MKSNIKNIAFLLIAIVVFFAIYQTKNLFPLKTKSVININDLYYASSEDIKIEKSVSANKYYSSNNVFLKEEYKEQELQEEYSDKINKREYTNEFDEFQEYLYENDTIRQVLRLNNLNENELDFDITSENKIEGIKSIIEGKAMLLGGDPEIDYDEEGTGYPSIQYIYKEKCYISIRIDILNRNRVNIIESSCENLRNESTPFHSIGLMYKIKK